MGHWLFSLGIILLYAANTLAGVNLSSCRCPTRKIIKLGDASNKVLRVCGEPDIITEIASATAGRQRGRAGLGDGSYWLKRSYRGVAVVGEN